MRLRKALFSLFTVTLLAFGGWLTILFNIDPTKNDRLMLTILYASIFLFVMGLLTFIGFGIRVLLSNREVIYAHFVPSFRQAIFIAAGLIGLLFLQSLRVLSPIDAGAFVLAIILLELFFRAKPKNYSLTEDEE